MRKFILCSLIVLVCGFNLSSQTWASLSPAAVTLEKSVHFMTPDGSNVVVEPGTYTIEPAEEWLRVIPGEPRDALLLEATRFQHNNHLEFAKALSQSDEPDEYRIILLMPDGTGFEAVGSKSGIRSRGVTRPLTSQTRAHPQPATQIPTQSKKITVVQNSKPLPTSPVQPNDPLVQRVQTLEQQVSSLRTLVNMLQDQLTMLSSAIQVDNAGNLKIVQAGTVTIQGSMVKINAASIDAQAGMSKFGGVVQADSVVTKSVVSSSYTPGAGNIW